jgi:uncharacterized protein with NRDE domain
MCTIVAVFEGDRLIIGANRDEFYARPALPPSELEPGIVGGRDQQAHGTWLGITRAALFVAVTNQRTLRPPDQNRHSRGELVLDALRHDTADDVARFIESRDGRVYNPFNLLWGDGRRLYVGYAREERAIAIEALPQGVTVLANDRIGAEEYPKTRRAELLLSQNVPLRSLLADHEKPPLDQVPAAPQSRFSHELLRELQALCIHTEHYGTRSSAIVELSPGVVHRYEHAEGAPCTHPFVDYTSLLMARTS